MDPFERIPHDLFLKEILRRLESQHISIATHVCKKWRTLLTPTVVRSLYSPHPLVLSNAFFVELECYDSRDAMDEHAIKAKNVRLVVDMQGRLYMHDIANSPVGIQPIKAATHNGLIAYVKHFAQICVISSAVRRVKRIRIPSSYFNPLNLLEFVVPKFQFTGMHFDATTADFMFLVGYSANISRVLWIYHSRPNSWTNLSEAVDFGNRIIPSCVGLYSWGCFFWYQNDITLHNRNEERMVGFNIEGRYFFDIEFPYLDEEEERESKKKKWALKGCEGWVVLVLNVDGEFKKCWRLVKNEDGYGWLQLTTDLRMLDCLFADFYKVDGRRGLFNINAQGWWCVANCASEESYSHDSNSDDYVHFTIYDEHGNLKHCIEKRQLISQLGIHDRYLRVKAVRPFQINNISWPRW